mmetsp:Transcript_5088/g.9749  ORF Transcript_5088/g.9749 Transcript_5088/m.9749 type:complete len:248 (+) Transcript_5088:37-780(+)|eukprot:CAMPEP_0172728392 /NCGR_PEP_ID=MMETSP1074-20121228/92218_1 /TAXON_ID=2916 /ORGANISM="Ceratium fusus, Strain PA161109" /LENGTH=247 /DNA_ID=CAMNT_0013555639 /DNA_START=14 /DNA_END=757 /DNA_ORIENTATION=+
MLRNVSQVVLRQARVLQPVLRPTWGSLALLSTAHVSQPLPTPEEVNKLSEQEVRDLIARAKISSCHTTEASELRALGQVALVKLKSELPTDGAKPQSLNYGLEHPFTVAFMHGMKNSTSNNHGQALVDFNRALDIAEKDGGRQCIEAAGVRNEIARIHAKTGKADMAVKLAADSVGIFERYAGTDSRMYAEAAYDLACYKALNRKPWEALELMRKCRPLFLKHLGADHPKTKQIGAAMEMMATRVGK